MNGTIFVLNPIGQINGAISLLNVKVINIVYELLNWSYVTTNHKHITEMF